MPNTLQIREDSKKGVYVENLKEIEVTSARDVLQQLIQVGSELAFYKLCKIYILNGGLKSVTNPYLTL